VIGFVFVFRRLGRALRRGFADPAFRGVLSLTVLLLAFGAFFFARVEGWTVFQGFYFSVITLTTVGYGDLAPVTFAGRLFTIFYVILGVGIIVALVTQVAHHAVEAGRRDQKGEQAA